MATFLVEGEGERSHPDSRISGMTSPWRSDKHAKLTLREINGADAACSVAKSVELGGTQLDALGAQRCL